MSSIISQMQAGFIEIAEKGEFPRNAKGEGVISTSTELDSVGSTTVNGKKVKYSNIVGFQELVTRASILNNPHRSDDHGYGCVNGWFSQEKKTQLRIITVFQLLQTLSYTERVMKPV